jgi:hypothetical protein
MEERMKAAKVIHLSIVIGTVAIYFLLGDLLSMNFMDLGAWDSVSYALLALPVAVVFGMNILYKNMLKSADNSRPLEEKLGAYQTANIVRWALLEGVSLILLILRPEMMLIGILCILYMAYLYPSVDRMKQDFEMLDF